MDWKSIRFNCRLHVALFYNIVFFFNTWCLNYAIKGICFHLQTFSLCIRWQRRMFTDDQKLVYRIKYYLHSGHWRRSTFKVKGILPRLMFKRPKTFTFGRLAWHNVLTTFLAIWHPMLQCANYLLRKSIIIKTGRISCKNLTHC